MDSAKRSGHLRKRGPSSSKADKTKTNERNYTREVPGGGGGSLDAQTHFWGVYQVGK
jgi:hypothetical protein